MRAYRCYLLNKAGAALKMLRENSQHHAIEVWDQARQVFRQARDAI